MVHSLLTRDDLIDFVVKLAKKIKKAAPEVKFILSSTSKQQVVIKCFTS